MTPNTQSRLLQEAEFIDRYVQYYRRQLTQAMRSSTDANNPCARMCLEALDLMRTSRQTLIDALAQSSPRK